MPKQLTRTSKTTKRKQTLAAVLAGVVLVLVLVGFVIARSQSHAYPGPERGAQESAKSLEALAKAQAEKATPSTAPAN